MNWPQPPSPLHDLAADDDRSAGVAEALRVVGDAGGPDLLAGARVERDQPRVGRGEEELVLIDGQVAARAGELALLDAHLVLPDQIAGAYVERLHHRAEVGEVEHAVVRDRRGGVPSAFVHRPHPLQLEFADVFARNRGKRAVAPGLVVAPHHQPVARFRVAQQLVGDRREVVHLARDGQAARHGCRRRARVGSPRPALGRCGYRRRGCFPGRHRADLDVGGRGQRLVPGRRAVRLQQVRDDVEISLVSEAARPIGGHREPDALDEILRGEVSPEVQKVGAGQRRGFEVALQIGPMADGAAPRVDGAAVLGLLRGMDAVPFGLPGSEGDRGGETAGDAQCGRRYEQASVQVLR